MQIRRQIGVLQAQGELVFTGAVDAVGQAAGLGAGAPVAAALADEGAHGALAGIAHAQRAVDEHLDLRAATAAHVGDVLAGKFTGQHHPLHAQAFRPACTAGGEQAHLGAGMDGQVRRYRLCQRQHAPILHQHCVHAHLGGLPQYLGGLGQLPVSQQSVQRQEYPHAPQMAVGHRVGELLVGEIFGVAAGVEGPKAHVHRVRPGLHRRLKGGAGAGRGEQLHHLLLLLRCWALNSWRFRSLASFLAAVASSR